MTTPELTVEQQMWTDEIPAKAGAGDSYYFVRRKDSLDVVVMGFSMGKAWLNGVSYEPSEIGSHLFLGPITPDLFIEIAQLRAIVETADRLIVALYDVDAIPPLMQYDVDGVRGRISKMLAQRTKEQQS